MNPKFNHKWTSQEDSILKNNWEAPPNMKILTELLQRTEAAIYRRARRLDLPTCGYSHRLKQDIRCKVNSVLEDLKTRKSLEFLLEKYKLSRDGFKTALQKDKCLEKTYLEILDTLKSTFICRYCKLELADKECYMDLHNHPNPHKVCKKCHRINKAHTTFNSLQTFIDTLVTRSLKYCGKDGDISMEFVEGMYIKQEGKCFYTGLPMKDIYADSKDFYLLSIDRLNSDRGYFKDNIVLCCWGINRMKSNIEYKKFIELCKLIAKNVDTAFPEYII